MNRTNLGISLSALGDTTTNEQRLVPNETRFSNACGAHKDLFRLRVYHSRLVEPFSRFSVYHTKSSIVDFRNARNGFICVNESVISVNAGFVKHTEPPSLAASAAFEIIRSIFPQ